VGKAALLSAIVAAAMVQRAPTDFVELDVVALDRQQEVVDDLRKEEFEIKDGGSPVTIQTLTPVSARGVVDEERSVVLLMDDIGVPSTGTAPMRQIARVLLSPMRLADEVAVVRLSRSRDEAFGDVQSASDRIDRYRGGMVPYSPRETPEMTLQTVARIAAQVEPVEHRRKAIVCLGPASVCDVREPFATSTAEYRVAWHAALGAAARANVSVYQVDPTGLTQSAGSSGLGLVRLTGGEVLRNSNDFGRAALRIWREASHYYLLGYAAAPASASQLRTIDVRATRHDVEVRTRRYR